ncbi:uncharacterized protein LOC115011447 [Cottoperca gobio]|uniref:Uncharacterized protein LOC115011447 n=1 Tax=Cottoperca gobio TaxID=56716 RepID=A0A6J2Q5B9_COTGO|nr:uncharacterized protein LOC115011447 [Cottoperca gobio]
MSCKRRRDQINVFLFVVTVNFLTFQVSHSVSLGHRGDGISAYQVQDNDAQQQKKHWRLVEQVTRVPGLTGLQSPVFPGEPIPSTSAATPDDSLSNGFHGVPGEVTGPPFDSSQHFFEWLAMRPLVQCYESFMTFTASGGELTHLLLDRVGASPIALHQLPSHCGYSVRISTSDLGMTVPYDSCYTIYENGSYVLPMLWWGSPLKLSCPKDMPSPSPLPPPPPPPPPLPPPVPLPPPQYSAPPLAWECRYRGWSRI